MRHLGLTPYPQIVALLLLLSALGVAGCDGTLATRQMNDVPPPPDAPIDPRDPLNPMDPSDPMDPTEPRDPTRPDASPRPDPPPGGAARQGNPNTLDQARLFTCTPQLKAATPSRMWRISPSQYTRAEHRVMMTTRFTHENPFAGTTSGWRFENPADEFTIEEAAVDALMRSPINAARRTLQDNKISGCIRQAWQDDALPDEGCQRSAVSFVGVRLFRRDLTPEELNRYQVRMANLIANSSPRRGIEAGLALMFTAPEFLFRDETGGELDADGRRRLTPMQLVGALAFALGDESPDEPLLRAAREGQLETTDQLRAQVRRLAGTSQADLAPLRRFMRELFRYHTAPLVFKERSITPGWQPEGFVEATDRFIQEILRDDVDVIQRLLTSDMTVSREQKNMPRMRGSDPERFGILTHRSWLVAHSQNAYNDPIMRGKFIRETLLAQHIPEIPIDVVPQLPPQRPDETMRQRLSEHSSAANCQTCHQLMDPLGLPFEQYEHHGEWRDMEAGRPVDTSGEIVWVSPELNGPVRDLRELMTRLASSTHVERALLRHLFRFTLGRDETYEDACTLAQMHEAYTMSQGSLLAALEALIVSDSFLYRRDAITKETP